MESYIFFWDCKSPLNGWFFLCIDLSSYVLVWKTKVCLRFSRMFCVSTRVSKAWWWDAHPDTSSLMLFLYGKCRRTCNTLRFPNALAVWWKFSTVPEHCSLYVFIWYILYTHVSMFFGVSYDATVIQKHVRKCQNHSWQFPHNWWNYILFFILQTT